MSPRIVLIALLVAGAFAAPARAQPVQLIPGTPSLTYEKQVQFTLHGLVGINVLVAPKPGGLWSLQPVLSNEVIPATEKLTAIEQRLSVSATTAGVNGDVVAGGGRPDGFLERNGGLDHDPRTARTSIGVDTSGVLHFDRISLYGYWQGAKTRHAFADLNEPPTAAGTTLYTPAWGPATPAAANGVAVVLRPFPAVAPNTDLVGTSVQVVPGGAAAIPPDGAVLVARGAAAPALQAEAPVGQAVHVRFALLPDWPSAGVMAGLGGGPLLVRNGKVVVKSGESIPIADLALREPRTAVGQRADGSIVLVSVDGGLPGSGLTNLELAQTLARLGVVNGAALAGGPTSGMAFDGHLLSAPAGGREQPVADALLVEYAGAYASLPPRRPCLRTGTASPRPRRSRTRSSGRPRSPSNCAAPTARFASTRRHRPRRGRYPFQWNARRADGTPEQEGTWAFVVGAVDDLGRSSSIERDFTLDLTLRSPKTIAPALTVPRQKARPVASFALTRRARVTTRVETTSGVLVRALGTDARRSRHADRRLGREGRVGCERLLRSLRRARGGREPDRHEPAQRAVHGSPEVG